MLKRLGIEFDPHPFIRGGSVCIVSVSVMHILQGFMLMQFPATGRATDVIMFLTVFHASKIGAELLLISGGFLGFFGAVLRLGFIRLMLFLPQHFFLGIMALGALVAVIQGSYLDGVIMEPSHILADQLPIFALFIVHSSAIIRRSRAPNG